MRDKDFNYMGKWASEMTKQELIDCCLEMIDTKERQTEIYRREREMLFSVLKDKRKGGLIARLLGH